MGGDYIQHRPALYFSGCMSPSCVPVHDEYSRVNIQTGRNRNRRLKKLLKKILNESKNMYGSKPITFQYDAVSYAQNFDEGCDQDEQFPRCHQVFPELRCK